MHSGDWVDLCSRELSDRLTVLGGEPEDKTIIPCRADTPVRRR